MFVHTSRYYPLETATYTTPTGRIMAYKRRRFLPLIKSAEVLAEHTVTEGERLDVITARYLADPELFWQICDVNEAMHPQELTEEIGRKLAISILRS